MIKNSVIIFLSLLSAVNLWAQGNVQAADIMNKTAKAVSALGSYKAKVMYSDAQFSTEVSIWAKDKKYRVDINDMTRLYDGVHFYNIMPSEKEVSMESVSEGNVTIGAMSDILNIFARNFKPSTAVKKGDVWFLTLLPKTANKEVKSVQMLIDANTFLPKSITEMLNAGNGTVIQVLSLKKDSTITDAFFIFDEQKYKKQGYYIAKP